MVIGNTLLERKQWVVIFEKQNGEIKKEKLDITKGKTTAKNEIEELIITQVVRSHQKWIQSFDEN